MPLIRTSASWAQTALFAQGCNNSAESSISQELELKTRSASSTQPSLRTTAVTVLRHVAWAREGSGNRLR